MPRLRKLHRESSTVTDLNCCLIPEGAPPFHFAAVSAHDGASPARGAGDKREGNRDGLLLFRRLRFSMSVCAFHAASWREHLRFVRALRNTSYGACRVLYHADVPLSHLPPLGVSVLFVFAAGEGRRGPGLGRRGIWTWCLSVATMKGGAQLSPVLNGFVTSALGESAVWLDAGVVAISAHLGCPEPGCMWTFGEGGGMDTTLPHRAEVPVGHFAPKGRLCLRLLLRGPVGPSHALEFQEWGLGINGVWTLIESQSHGPVKSHSWRSLEFQKGCAQATLGCKGL